MTGERCELRHRLKEDTGDSRRKSRCASERGGCWLGGVQQALVCGTPRIGPSHFLMRNEESRYSAKTSMGYLRGERNFEISYAILCSLDIQQQTVNAKQLFPLSINLISRRDFVVSGLKLQGSTKLNMLFEVLPNRTVGQIFTARSFLEDTLDIFPTAPSKVSILGSKTRDKVAKSEVSLEKRSFSDASARRSCSKQANKSQGRSHLIQTPATTICHP
uniref:Uncharacterized protein n=1 Tax=Vespula pensylvanica TaxID=30213 RepID=A0A834PCA6_VESPE|nr:hypothetical protein H0235_003596 [Vespula pensylvanica]